MKDCDVVDVDGDRGEQCGSQTGITLPPRYRDDPCYRISLRVRVIMARGLQVVICSLTALLQHLHLVQTATSSTLFTVDGTQSQ